MLLNYYSFYSNTDPARAEGQRSWVTDQMVGLIRNTKIPKEEDWISHVLEFLFVHAFFDIIKNGSKVSEVRLWTVNCYWGTQC